MKRKLKFGIYKNCLEATDNNKATDKQVDNKIKYLEKIKLT